MEGGNPMPVVSLAIAVDGEKLAALCVRRRVARLELFGSGPGESFEPDASDLDFLVEFQAMPPPEHADAYFGLHDELERMFRRPVDLVELTAIQNPYFLASIEHSRVVLYAA
jgi:predicted nucleotidyltransferase